MTGYTGSGKTTILTVLDKHRDVTDEDIRRDTSNDVLYRIGYTTAKGKKVFIKSTDTAGLEARVNKTDFVKLLNEYKYFVYIINVDSYLGGVYTYQDKEIVIKWYKEIYDHAKNTHRPMILVLSHADTYLKRIKKPDTKENRDSEIRNKFFGANGILSILGCNPPDEMANIQKFKEVQRIMDRLIG